jgi:hypothetical protein
MHLKKDVLHCVLITVNCYEMKITDHNQHFAPKKHRRLKKVIPEKPIWA